MSASFAVGLNAPVSMLLMVLRETPTICARSDCDQPRSLRRLYAVHEFEFEFCRHV